MNFGSVIDPQAAKKPTPTAAALTAAAGVPAASGFSSVSPTAPTSQGMLTAPPVTAAAPLFQQSQANDLFGQLADYSNQVSKGAALPSQLREGLVNFWAGGPNAVSNYEDPAVFNDMITKLLTTKSDADLLGGVTAHAEHLRDPSNDFLEKAIPMAINMGGMALLGPQLASAFGGGMLGAAGAGALTGGIKSLMSGGDIGKGIAAGVKGSALSSGIGEAANFAAPAINDLAGSLGLSGQQVADSEAFKLPKNGIQVADASDILGGPSIGFSTPASIGGVDAFGNPTNYSTPAITTDTSNPYSPVSTPTNFLPGGMLSATPELPTGQQPQQQQGVTGKDIQQYAKLAQSVNSFLGKNSQQGPQRADGQSDQAYSQQLAQYMNLDADAMSKMGLVPGTPEYEQYIMQQANSVIQQSGIDPNGDLTQQFQGHTQQELEQLQRALYVRGQMDTLVGPGQYTDPFTGQSQDVSGPQGSTFQPSVGAYERGLAGSVDQLAGLGNSPQALDYLHGMLGRHADLFGMQKAQDASLENARLNDQIEQEQQGKHKKGMLSPGRGNMFNSMTPDELQQLVMRSGGDESTQRAAMEQLLGIPGYSG